MLLKSGAILLPRAFLSVALALAAAAGPARSSEGSSDSGSSAAAREPFEELPALAVDDEGTLFLAVVERTASRIRIAVDEVQAGARKRIETLELPGNQGVGAPSLVGLGRGAALAFSAAPPEGGYRIHHIVVGAGPSRLRTLEPSGGVNIRPQLARAGDRIAIAWESNASGERSIRVAWIDPDADSSSPVTVSEPGSNGRNPDIVGLPDGRLFVAWGAFSASSYDLYGAWLEDGKWQPPIRLTTSPRNESHVQLTLRKAQVWLAWQSDVHLRNRPLRIEDRRIHFARLKGTRLLRPSTEPWMQVPLQRFDLPGQPRAGANETSEDGGESERVRWPFGPSTGLIRPQIAFSPNGVLWATARQSLDMNAGWATIWRSLAQSRWGSTHLLLEKQGRWHASPVVWTSEGAVAAVQWDEQPARFSNDPPVDTTWRSRVEIVTLAATTPAIERLGPPPREKRSETGRRRRNSYASQPRITRSHAGRTLSLFWGNLHAHSSLSLCDRAGNPPPADLFAIERDLDELDFVALTDHGRDFNDPTWQYAQEAVARYHDPGRFVTLLGEEWTSSLVLLDGDDPPGTNRGHTRYGHHNLIFLEPRHPTFYDSRHPPHSPRDLIDQIGDHPFVMIPHGLADWQFRGLGNPPIDWAYHDEVAMPLAEIYQARGSYECYGCPRQAPEACPFPGNYLQDAWEAGRVVGTIAAPDHPGGDGYAGVWTDSLTREALFSGFRARHTIGTTGEKIGLFFASGESLMGDKVRREKGKPIDFQIAVWSQAAIEEVVVLRNNEPVFRATPGTPHADLLWTDRAPLDLPRSWYYVRVSVAAAEPDAPNPLAWSSPIWFFDEVPAPRRLTDSSPRTSPQTPAAD